MFSREFGRPKKAKVNIYLGFGGCWGFRCGSLFGAVVVSTGCRWCRVQGLPVSCGVCSVPFFLPFVPLLLLLSCISLEICLISHFKGVFRGFYGVRVGLCCLGALRGLCGFCARVELGGLKDCGVFASVFLLLSLCLLSFYALCLFLCPLCSYCLLLVLSFFVGCCWVCCFFFPYG